MRNQLLIIGCLLFFNYFQLSAQPTELRGCHMWHQQSSAIKLTPEQEAWYFAPVERSDTFDILDYDLTIDLTNFKLAQLIGKALITFKPKIAGNQILNLDLLNLTIDSIKYMDGSSSSYTYRSPLLTVKFPEELEVDSTYQVTVFYHGRPTTSPSGFGGFYFEDGIAYNLGIGLTDDPHNYGRSWFPCFDNFVERSTYTYRVITPEKIKAYCVGTFISDTLITPDLRLRTYRMNQLIPTYLSAIAASTYTDYDYTHQSIYGDLPVQLVAKPENMEDVKESFKNLNYAVDALESWYGKYPFERVGYVMTTRGAMEHPGNIAYPLFTTAGGMENRRLYSHELTHLWWGDLTTLKTQADMWIKEGNAEYGSHLFAEYFEGRASMEQILKENNNKVITTAHTDDGGYLPLSPMPKSITYGTTTYNKGAMVMHSMRGYLGDDLFRTSQQAVLYNNQYNNLTAESYKNALTAASGIDMTDFFKRWVLDTGFYDFVITDFKALDLPEYNYELTIKQKLYHSSDFCIDAPITITFSDSQNQLHTERVIATGETTVIPLKLDYNATSAFLNAPMALNLAQYSQLFKIKSTGGIVFPFGVMTLSINAATDSTWLYAEHHLTPADRPLSANVNFRLSKDHFWKISIADSTKIGVNGRLEYSLGSDRSVLTTGEDSLQLFYRPNNQIEWAVYPYALKLGGSPSDKRGTFSMRKVMAGEYVFGNIDKSALKNHLENNTLALATYPNPVSDRLNIELPSSLMRQNYMCKLINSAGIEVFSNSVSSAGNELLLMLPKNLASGNYVVQIYDQSQSFLAQSKIAIVN